MVDKNDHSACVDAWLARVGTGLPSERLLDVFEQGFGAVWRRAHLTLGDVTLTAIGDRVLYSAAEQFPIFSALELQATGLQCKALHERLGNLQHEQLAQGIRFVLVEFLTVLGNLTADILTPALHAELTKVAPEESGPGEASGARPTASLGTQGNGEESEL
jgi:hypothetical protein